MVVLRVTGHKYRIRFDIGFQCGPINPNFRPKMGIFLKSFLGLNLDCIENLDAIFGINIAPYVMADAWWSVISSLQAFFVAIFCFTKFCSWRPTSSFIYLVYLYRLGIQLHVLRPSIILSTTVFSKLSRDRRTMCPKNFINRGLQ